MDKEPPRKAKVLLHPAMMPSRVPGFDIHTYSDDEFRDLMQQVSDYLEVYQPNKDRRYAMRGLFQARGGKDNAVFVRLTIKNAGGEAEAEIDLTEASCVEIAGHMLTFAVSLSNMNGTPETIAVELTNLLGTFLHPDTFDKLKAALMVAAKEELRARLLAEELGKTAKA